MLGGSAHFALPIRQGMMESGMTSRTTLEILLACAFAGLFIGPVACLPDPGVRAASAHMPTTLFLSSMAHLIVAFTDMAQANPSKQHTDRRWQDIRMLTTTKIQTIRLVEMLDHHCWLAQ